MGDPSDPTDRKTLGDAELALLKELWDRGPLTVRELCDALEARGAGRAYTTVQTMLNRLVEKGFVAVDRDGHAHVFRAAVSRDALIGRRLRELADKLCDGAVTPLLLNLVDRERFSAEDIARLRAIVDAAAHREPEEEP